VIDILTSEDMENMSLCISQYLTLYYIISIVTANELIAHSVYSARIFIQIKRKFNQFVPGLGNSPLVP
jgi:hypothetical protein